MRGEVWRGGGEGRGVEGRRTGGKWQGRGALTPPLTCQMRFRSVQATRQSSSQAGLGHAIRASRVWARASASSCRTLCSFSKETVPVSSHSGLSGGACVGGGSPVGPGA